jgi:DNA repair protein RecO (recombination protein O)
MPQFSAEALVLRTYALGESDSIVAFLTRDRGKRRGVARGAQRSRRRFGGALEPLTLVRVTYQEREQRDLVRLEDAAVLQSPLAAPGAAGLLCVGYFADLIDRWAPEADPNERLFRLGVAALGAVVAGAPAAALARYFEHWLLRLQGVAPSLLACQRCGTALGARGAWLSRPELVLLCQECGPAGGAPDLSPAALAFLAAVRALPPDRLGEVALPEGAERELERVHRQLIAVHLDRDLRSGRVLRAVVPGA